MSARSRIVAPVLLAASLVAGCSAVPSAERAREGETIAACVPESPNVVDLNVRSVDEAIDLTACLAERIKSEAARHLTVYLRSSSPVEIAFNDDTGEYITRLIGTKNPLRTGPLIAFVGQEHAESSDTTLRKLSDPKDGMASALTKDSAGQQLILLAHPRLVSPSVTAFGILHQGLHAFQQDQAIPEKPSCIQGEAANITLLADAFVIVDYRNGAWLQEIARLRQVQVSLDVQGQLMYEFANTIASPPNTSQDTTPKSYASYDLWRNTALVATGIFKSGQNTQDQQALLLAEAGRHCIATA